MNKYQNDIDNEMQCLGYRIQNEIGTLKKYDRDGNVVCSISNIPAQKILEYNRWKDLKKKEKIALQKQMMKEKLSVMCQ